MSSQLWRCCSPPPRPTKTSGGSWARAAGRRLVVGVQPPAGAGSGGEERRRGRQGLGQPGQQGEGLGRGGGQARGCGAAVAGQGVADAEALLLVRLEHVGEAEALAAHVTGVGLLAGVRAPVPLHVGPAGEALAADLADVRLLPCGVGGVAGGPLRPHPPPPPGASLRASTEPSRPGPGTRILASLYQPRPTWGGKEAGAGPPSGEGGPPRGAAVPVWVFMCSSKYCFMLKSLPHHWHMNCLWPMWMLMCDRSWYLYWKRSLQF